MSREQNADAAWGADLPDWVRALARAVDSGRSQASLARSIGYSTAVISQILTGKYPGSLDRVEAAVRAAVMNGVVACPVLGEIDGETCLANQRREFSSASSMRVRLWKTCRACHQNIKQ